MTAPVEDLPHKVLKGDGRLVVELTVVLVCQVGAALVADCALVWGVGGWWVWEIAEGGRGGLVGEGLRCGRGTCWTSDVDSGVGLDACVGSLEGDVLC